MILSMFSIQDIKSGLYNPPQYFLNEQVALREYKRMFSKEGSTIHDFPQDYRVHKVGRYDDSRGIVLPLTNPKFIAEMSDVLNPKDVFHVKGKQPLATEEEVKRDNAQ